MEELKKEVETDASSNQVKIAFAQETKVKSSIPAYRNSPRFSPSSPSTYENFRTSSSAQALAIVSRNKYYIFCPGVQSHWVEECKKLPELSPSEVKEMVLKGNACFCCFRKGHRAIECKTRNNQKCDKCNSTRHNSYLHEEASRSYVTQTTSVEENIEECTQRIESVCIHASQGKCTMMPIIKVKVTGNNGKL